MFCVCVCVCVCVCMCVKCKERVKSGKKGKRKTPSPKIFCMRKKDTHSVVMEVKPANKFVVIIDKGVKRIILLKYVYVYSTFIQHATERQ